MSGLISPTEWIAGVETTAARMAADLQGDVEAEAGETD
jgi:hypothetical protein